MERISRTTGIFFFAAFIIYSVLILHGCSREEEMSFQKNREDPKVKLFQILDETPALKSLFTGLDMNEFNQKANDLINSNPDLLVDLSRRLAETFYGDKAVLPLTVRDVSDSFSSFHSIYSRDPHSLDTAIDMGDRVLSLDSATMIEGVDSITDLLAYLRDNTPVFNEGQEFGDIGVDGVTKLIDTFDFVHELYDNAADLSQPAALVQNFIQTLVDDNVDVETRVDELIDYFGKDPGDPESVTAIEEGVADWLVADSNKSDLVTYLIEDLYPMVKEPIIEDAEGEKNFIIRGRGLIDEEARILTATASRLTGGTSPDTTYFLKYLMQGAYHDLGKLDRLDKSEPYVDANDNGLYDAGETFTDTNGNGAWDGFECFDWEHNDLGNFVRKDLVRNRLAPALNLLDNPGTTGPEDARMRLKTMLWDGWTYTATDGNTTAYKGILYNSNPGNAVYDPATASNDGYVIRMAKFKSSDSIVKTFRQEMQALMPYKSISQSYADESLIEACFSNLYLYLMSSYYSPARNKWALDANDGKEFFGDSNRNLQSMFGGLTTCLRNAVMLDKYAMKNVSATNMSLASELLYVLSASHGIAAKSTAPAELTVKNCLLSMGSALGSSESMTIDNIPLIGSMTVRVLGDNAPFRISSLDYPDSPPESAWTQVSTQHDMAVLELLQPGMFRQRTGSTGVNTSTWHGRFAASQGDIVSTVNEAGKITTTNWVMAEIALACWEGYGPYTYKGKAPNGSICRYKSDWNTDWYRLKSSSSGFGDRGPGVGEIISSTGDINNSGADGRYHLYEMLYKPKQGDPGFVPADDNPAESKVGYIRPDGTSGDPDYYLKSHSAANGELVTLDCSTREEAIRKNLQWLMTQKRYIYVIPIHGWVDDDILKILGIPLAHIWMEVWSYASINANGFNGLALARRYQYHTGDNGMQNNATWPGAGAINTRTGDEVRCNVQKEIRGNTGNYVLDVEDEGSRTYRMRVVSTKPSDFMIAVDYSYDYKMSILGIGVPDNLAETLLNILVKIHRELWDALGNGTVLPGEVADNFPAMLSMATAEYSPADVSSNPGAENMDQFAPFYNEYYPDLILDPLTPYDLSAAKKTMFQWYQEGHLKASELPPVPRVNGVYYPESFDSDGDPDEWAMHEGNNKGKFEELAGIVGLVAGTIHEDGGREFDSSGNLLYYSAGSGFRQHVNNIVMTLCALNESKKNASTNYPAYNSKALINVLTDYSKNEPFNDLDHDGTHDGNEPYVDINGNGVWDAGTNSVVPGSRLGLLPAVFTSKYLNISYMSPVKGAVESLLKHTIRRTLNHFETTRGNPANPNADIDQYYRTTTGDWRGDYILDGDGRKIRNPNIDWSLQINRLRYFADSNSLAQLKKTLTMVTDMSKDERFVEFLKKTVIAGDKYFVVKYMEQNAGSTWNSAVQNAVQLYAPEKDAEGNKIDRSTINRDEYYGKISAVLSSDVRKIVDFLGDFRYEEFIGAVEETTLNDIEAFYNFSVERFFDTWDNALFQENLDELGEKLVKLGGYAIMDGYVDGIYEVLDNSTIPIEVRDRFAPGDLVWGHGRYVEQEDGTIDYIDIRDQIQGDTDSSKFKKHFAGVRTFFDFKQDGNETFSPYCMEYRNPYYRNGEELCPNIYNLHNYDLKFSYLMGEFNTSLINLKQNNFEYGAANPDSLISVLWGWDEGTSSFTGPDPVRFMNGLKNDLLAKLYDEEVDIANPNTGEKEDGATTRDAIGWYRQWLMDNVFEYEYSDSTGTHREQYRADETGDIHFHAANNAVNIVDAVLNPDSPSYKTKRLFDAWVNFVEKVDVDPEDLQGVQKAVGDLVYNRDEGRYTHLITNLCKNLPQFMTIYKGRYDDLVQLGLLAFSDGGIGSYLMEAMELDDRYDSWDIVEETNYLLQTDIFRNYVERDTFWWQAGNLIEDLAILLDRRGPSGGESGPVDYYGAFGSLFR